MKKTAIILIFAACVMLAGCGDNSSSGSGSDNSGNSVVGESDAAKTPAEKTAELSETIELPSMVEVTSDNLSLRYGIDAESVEDFSAYICGSGAFPDEFGIFVAVDSDAASEIKAALESRVEKQRSTYTDYTPDEMYKFDDCFVKQSGNTVYYAICADNTAAEDILG